VRFFTELITPADCRMATKASDLAFGLMNEDLIQTQIESIAGTPLIKQGGYSVMDYTNDAKTVYVELKTRRIKHNAYPTALIGANKIEFCSDPQKNYFFVFCYLDGIYFIKYDEALFNTFERSDNYYRGARSDCFNSVQSVFYIPIERLTHLAVQ
jgi:hypothetical protein